MMTESNPFSASSPHSVPFDRPDLGPRNSRDRATSLHLVRFAALNSTPLDCCDKHAGRFANFGSARRDTTGLKILPPSVVVCTTALEPGLVRHLRLLGVARIFSFSNFSASISR